MKRQEKIPVVYFLLGTLTLAFLAMLFWSARDPGAEAQTDEYRVVTERTVPREAAAERGPIDINTATADELQELMGIGPALAQAIVDYRAEHGPFASVDELLEVSGIGEGKLDGIREDVTVGGGDE